MPPRAPKTGAPQKDRFWSRGLQYALIGAFLLAPLLALLIQLARVPDGAPAPVATIKPRALSPFIAGLLANPRAAEFECSLDEINVHLAQLLTQVRRHAAGVSLRQLELRLEPGGCTVLATHLWRGRQWHTRVHYQVLMESGRLQWKPDSGSLGRVHLGARWTKHLQAPLLKLQPLLKKETVLLSRLESLRMESNRLSLKVRPSSPAQFPELPRGQ
jgi:hypothetical protein